MSFSETFNAYLTRLDITYAKFAAYSGLSVSVVRRYKNGESEPAPDSEQIKKLADGICRLAEEKGIEADSGQVLAELQTSLKNNLSIPYEAYLENLHTLLKTMDIRVSALAKALSFDSSYISKILAGQRKPGQISKFTQSVGSYIARICTDEEQLGQLAGLLGCAVNDLDSPRAVSDAVVQWLGSNTVSAKTDPVGNFLGQLESFNLDEFINVIHFNDIKLPTVPFQLPTHKSYTTIEGMKKCEMDFIRATVLSKSKQDVIMYSDMPLEEMAKDAEFAKNGCSAWRCCSKRDCICT